MPLKEIDLHAPLKPIEFLVPDLLPFGYVSFLGAREGVGKTTLLTALAWQMTRPVGQGRFLGRPVVAGPVLYLNTDAADGESRPVRFWLAQHRTVNPDGDLSRLAVLESTGAGLSREELGELLNLAREKGVRAVIMDSFMGTFPGLDGNKLEQVMGPMIALRDFAAQTGAAVIVTDHLPKKAPGEKLGDRGIMGSTAKTAQARAVHILTGVPPKDVDGREVLRWEVRKASFAASGHAFGVEVLRELDDEGRPQAVRLEACELPEEDGRDTRGERAAAAVMVHLEGSQGEPVLHGDLVALAIEQGNLRERAAREAVGRALGQMWERLEVTPAKRGSPKSYRLKVAGSAAPELYCQSATNRENTVPDSGHLVAEVNCHPSETATHPTPAAAGWKGQL